jgi:hypothetical protein
LGVGVTVEVPANDFKTDPDAEAVRDGLLRKRITRYGQVLEEKKAVGSALVSLLFSVLALVGGMVLGWAWLKGRIVW